MTREEALKYDNILKEKLEKIAHEYGLEVSAGADIVENYIIVWPEEKRKGMIFLGKDPASYKIKNIQFDLKRALVGGLEFTVSTRTPDGIFNYVRFLIRAILLIIKVSKKELGRLEASIVFLLHQKGCYQEGTEEVVFINLLREWYEQRGEEPPEKDIIVNAINWLYNIGIVDFWEGDIYLKEQVWGRIE